MAVGFDDSKRKLVPRWRDSRLPSGGELATTAADRDLFDREQFSLVYSEWKRDSSLDRAGELVGAAIVNGHLDEAKEAARQLLREATPGSNLRRLGERALGLEPAEVQEEDPAGVAPAHLRQLRRLLRADPRNAIALVDMSREYAIQGQHRQAVKAMESALVLAAENRFVLRAACALFVYSGEPDRAMRAIHRSNSTKKDPWLMAAEIASSEAAHRPPKSIKAGLRLLESRTVAPFQFAELAGALATEELNSGAARSAKKLFRTALIDPNENTVAQVEWAAESIKGLPLEPRHFLLPHSFESKAREMRSQGKWREALAQTRRWLFDQPFSAAPALLGSYIAVAALSDHKEAARLARAGLVANPHNDLLKNNLAVALAVAGDVAEATRILSTIDHETNNRALRATFLATNGLISYRLGAIDQGRLLYGRAIELLGAPGLQRMRANAALYRAREELLAGQDHALEFARAAKKLSEISEPLETGVLLSTVEALAASKGVVM